MNHYTRFETGDGGGGGALCARCFGSTQGVLVVSAERASRSNDAAFLGVTFQEAFL